MVATTVTALVMGTIGVLDYKTGYEISFLGFYLLAIALAAWFVSKPFANLIAALSVVGATACDWLAGEKYSNSLIPIWNGLVTLSLYMVVIWLLNWFKITRKTLETRVQERTVALLDEIAERKRLEQDILAVSEREQRRIGDDLHDGLCQHLTGTALACATLEQDLAESGQAEHAADARRMVDLIQESISVARDTARGLSAVPLEPQGLMNSLSELAARTRKYFKTDCRFVCPVPVLIDNPQTAVHLYRIAQEAVNNSVRHANGKSIVIDLSGDGSRVVFLVIKDDGCGLPSKTPPGTGTGMGMRIMKHRASMIDGAFSAARSPAGGTAVSCLLDRSPPPCEILDDV